MNTLMIEPVRSRRLSEEVEGRIRELFDTRQLEPGDRLPTEKEMGARFGVSLVTVREALRGLETRGLVEKKRGKDGGVYATAPASGPVKDMLQGFLNAQNCTADDLRQVRVLLEPGVARLAAGNISVRQVERLEENVQGAGKMLAGLGPSPTHQDYLDFEHLSIEFHRLAAEATGNPALVFMVDYVMDTLLSFTRRQGLSLDKDICRRTLADHRRLLSLFRAGDAGGAAREMERHAGRVGGYLVARETPARKGGKPC
jgi:GntR family transcriptional regulator, transcriptional repressor for pyruvate dehydrogenase complex